jgi:hypothetical protein
MQEEAPRPISKLAPRQVEIEATATETVAQMGAGPQPLQVKVQERQRGPHSKEQQKA